MKPDYQKIEELSVLADWSFQLLLALESVAPVRRFRVSQDHSWEVEFYEKQRPFRNRPFEEYVKGQERFDNHKF